MGAWGGTAFLWHLRNQVKPVIQYKYIPVPLHSETFLRFQHVHTVTEITIKEKWSSIGVYYKPDNDS
jgi:hypothetical protein